MVDIAVLDAAAKWRGSSSLPLGTKFRLIRCGRGGICVNRLYIETRIYLNNKMKYIVYKITNLINGKYYIGVHQTCNIDDGYMGSGVLLHAAYKKYGVENFNKEIIANCKDPNEMFEIEHDLVETNSKNKMSYNLMDGGHGGFNYINSLDKNGTKFGVKRRLELLNDHKWYNEWKEKQIEGCHKKNNTILKEEYTRRGKKANETAKLRNGVYPFEGKSHSNETKMKIGRKNSINQSGFNNSRYGSMWITNGTESKSIPKDSIIPSGWRKGRKMK